MIEKIIKKLEHQLIRNIVQGFSISMVIVTGVIAFITMMEMACNSWVWAIAFALSTIACGVFIGIASYIANEV